ncbi:MAG: hypothetical protein GXN91_04100, partial [Epsilonproteobacteria bacterium]|nr:hypothetical protein [Campylobacterota bacterium]
MKGSNYILVAILSSSLSYGAITGNVFRDLPLNGGKVGAYGVKEPNEPPVSGVRVTAVDEHGNRAQAVTNEEGEYRLTGLKGKVRVEFSNWPSYLQESFGTKSGSSVQFCTDGDKVDFALHNPQDYVSTNNPYLISSVYFNGATNIPSASNTKDLLRWKIRDYKDNSYNVVASKSQLGTIWGLAYDKEKQDIYAAAFLRRHTGLLDSDGDGYGDVGVIYRIDRNNNIEEFYRFDNSEVGTIKNDEGRGLPDRDAPSADAEAFGKVGNIGLGDIDLSADKKTLYVVNLYQHKLYGINTQTQDIEESVDIPNECRDPKDARAFALKSHDGNLYVGVTCVGLNSQRQRDLKAMVYSYNEDGFKKVIEVPLTYKKGAVFENKGTSFKPWVRDWNELYKHKGRYVIHPQPLLSDIEFAYKDGQKYMILSFLDRTGLQTGYRNSDTSGKGIYEGMSGGDVLIAQMRSDGKAVLERSGRVGNRRGKRNGQGPGGGEFFHADDLFGWHQEVALGGIACIAGDESVGVNSYDPVRVEKETTWATGGPRFFNLKDGSYRAGKKLYLKDEPGVMGKAAGVGDLEVITDAAPIEIGDRVWLDSNGNGIQDAGERGIAGVKLLLSEGLDCSNVVDRVTTDSEGKYLFRNLKPNFDYTICIDESQFKRGRGVRGTPLEDLIITTPNRGEDRVNSDAEVGSNGQAIIRVQTRNHGENNHNYDIGCVGDGALPADTTSGASIGDYVWYDKNINGIQDPDEYGIGYIKVYLLDENNNVLQETRTDLQGKYLFENLTPGVYKIQIALPRNYPYFTLQNQGDESKDSDVNPKTGISDPITLSEGEHYRDLDAGLVCQICSKIDIEKFTNDQDADEAPGPMLVVGSKVTWTYKVKNISNADLSEIKVIDSQEGEISCPKDTLAPAEFMICTHEGIVKEGQYENIATVTSVNPLGNRVEDSDPSHYYGGKPGVDIEKSTNGEDA